MSELFPSTEPFMLTVMAPGIMGRGWTPDVPLQVGIWTCARCGAVVSSKDQHTRWHASVDSSATIALGGKG